jgi:FlaG/FlaF family flagellin (archaellin)
MDVLAFCTEDDAVSSVLGVVLMVAITIILAAIVGTFVLGIGEGLTNPTPEVVFDYSTDVNDDDSKKSSVTILHAGGDGLESERLEVTIEGETAWAGGSDSGPYTATRNWPNEVTGGDRLRLEDDTTTINGGEEVLIIWTGENQATILSKTKMG